MRFEYYILRHKGDVSLRNNELEDGFLVFHSIYSFCRFCRTLLFYTCLDLPFDKPLWPKLDAYSLGQKMRMGLAVALCDLPRQSSRHGLI